MHAAPPSPSTPSAANATGRRAPLHTWFGVGGGAAQLQTPESTHHLAALIRDDPALRVIGEGANLLIDDDGVGGLVVSLAALNDVTHPDERTIRVGAGVSLMRLIAHCVRDGLAGLETLAGIPASIGGALAMNAGGRFGEIADSVLRVHTLDRDANELTIERPDIPFAYRHSGLDHLVITGADLRVQPVAGDAHARLTQRFAEIKDFKKNSQPMRDNSAGCVFRNPTLERPIDHIGDAGQRVSAGMLIDHAGCKGLGLGGAVVSAQHANFITTGPGATARDVIELIGLVRERVHAHFGLTLETEVVIWSDHA